MASSVTIIDGQVTSTPDQGVRRATASPSTPEGHVIVPGFGPVPEAVAARLAASGDLQVSEEGEYSSGPQEAPEESSETPRDPSVLNVHETFGESTGLLADAMANGNTEIAVEAVAEAAGVSMDEAQEAVASVEQEVRLEVNGVLAELGISEDDFGAVAQYAARHPEVASKIARAALSGKDLAPYARQLGRAFLTSRGEGPE